MNTAAPCPPDSQAQEIRKLRRSFPYFATNYCQILVSEAVDDPAEGGDWQPFRLWPDQVRAAEVFQRCRKVVALKARQIGFTWLALAYVLWLITYHPIATALLWSKRDDEAMRILLGRLKGMLDRLPDGYRPAVVTANAHELELANGSHVYAFPTGAGHGYTGTVAIIDEADKMQTKETDQLPALLNAVKPTVDAGGKLFLISTAEKAKPQSLFKKIFHAARRGENGYTPLFFPWWARPDRTAAWYEAEKRSEEATKGTLDDLYQEYPASVEEALSPRSLDKRLPPQWVTACYREGVRAELALLRHLESPAPSLPGLTVYAAPAPAHTYVVGADPAAGNPTSDESAACVMDEDTGAQAAVLAGRLQPDVFAAQVADVAAWYNNAAVLVESNNHGHAVILWLRDNAPHVNLLRGMATLNQPGWQTTSKSKALLYDGAAVRFREGRCLVRDPTTYYQLCSIEGATLSAPEGEHDDRAISFALALAAIDQTPRGQFKVYV